MDRGLDPNSGDACARRSLRRSASALRGQGPRRPYDPDRSDQFVEPAGDRLPLSASGGTGAVPDVDASMADAKHRFTSRPRDLGAVLSCDAACAVRVAFSAPFVSGLPRQELPWQSSGLATP